MPSVTKRAHMFAIDADADRPAEPVRHAGDLAQRYLAYVRRLPDDVVLKPEPIKTAKEAIESRTNRSYLPDTRGGGLQCRSSLHGHDHSRHRWGIDLYLGRR
jgi:hypothetical protein